MADEPPGDFTYLLQLMLERATTLSVQLETLRRVLVARGVLSAAEIDQMNAELRAQWHLQEHPHESLSRELSPEDYFARMRGLFDRPTTEDEPTK